MARILLPNPDATTPVAALKRMLRDALSEQFGAGEWVVWQELKAEEPGGSPLCSVRSMEVTDRAIIVAGGVPGREITVMGEIRIAATPESGGLQIGDEPSALDSLSDGVDSFLFSASQVPTIQTPATPERGNLDALGIIITSGGPRRESTDEGFFHVNRHAFTATVAVSMGGNS